MRQAFATIHGKFLLGLILVLIFSSTGITLSQATRIKMPVDREPYVIFDSIYSPISTGEGLVERGIASWYGDDFHGLRTSNGEVYNMYGLTAAHKTLPMDTRLLVKNLDNGKKIVVRVNDRGPFVQDRILDLSFKAAKSLGMVVGGLARVQIVPLGQSGGMEVGMPAPESKNGEYYVQIATFSQETNARHLQKRFAAAGHSVVVDRYDRGRPALYRVQVYAGRTVDDARESEQLLLKYGYSDSFIVAR